MASAQKQAKRAKRAKSKAKEARVVRNNAPKYDTTETTELGDKGHELFERMSEAESHSRVEMLKVLINDALSIGSDDPAAVQRVLLSLYGRWKNGEHSRLESGWWKEESFLADYAEAARSAGAEELIDAWLDEEELA